MKNQNPITPERTNALVVKHHRLVFRIASHMLCQFPSSVQLDDVMQAGFIGLIDAAKKYDAALGASFETYAGIRIRGEILDDMRGVDWTPRSVYKKQRDMDRATRKIENKKCGKASHAEVAGEMGISLDDYFKISSEYSRSNVNSTDEDDTPSFPVDTETPLDILSGAEIKRKVAEMVNALEDTARFVIVMYYHHGLTLVEIATMIGVSESRACQIRGESVDKLRRAVSWVV
jgi:RNA polymerase sigma factor for flagellar operon FliA